MSSPPPPPPPPDASSFSLHPETASTNAPPEVNQPGSDIFPNVMIETNPMADMEDLSDHLLVVYNSNDADSRDLALYYASRRGIQPDHVLSILCPDAEEITREQFEKTIRVPIMSYLTVKDWMSRMTQQVRVGNRYLDLLVATRNDIWAIVLMRGVPLKIAPDPTETDAMELQPELQTNAAAVDSELALLPIFGLPEGGYVQNIFFDSQVNGIKHVGPEQARNLVLVTRLDGPTPADVRRMIDDCLYAETHRLAGLAVVDSRGLTDVNNGYTSGDVWLRGARDALVQDGWKVKFDDKPELIPATDPCNQVAIYLGWYSENAMGPWVTPPNRFVPGAIAYHLHSFSANSLRSETNNWVGPLIAHGADATMGMVYEPYLALTPHEDIFTRRLLEGDYFAEAAYASERGLSWMLTVVGDPLYRPFRVPFATALADAVLAHSPNADWLLLQKVQREISTGQIPATTQSLVHSLDVPGAGVVAQEGLAELLDKLNDPTATVATEEAYKTAAARAILPVDRIRIGLELAQFYGNHGQETRAQNELDVLRERFPDDAKRFGVASPLVPTSVPSPPSAPVNQPSASLTPSGSRPSLPKLPSLPKPTPASP